MHPRRMDTPCRRRAQGAIADIALALHSMRDMIWIARTDRLPVQLHATQSRAGRKKANAP